ncbi:MAG: glycosyltransferase [Actinomycetales bacterium]|nr:glycosyltransferase [Actinomycetales bacterium]
MGTIVVLGSTVAALTDEMNRATTSFISVVTEPLSFSKNGLAALLNEASSDITPDVLYADSSAIRRPDFSAERLRCQNYLGELIVYRTTFLQGIGGYRSEFGMAAAYDLALRATVAAAVIAHIPSVVYRTQPRASGSQARMSADHDAYTREFTSALTEHLHATGGGHVVSIDENGVFDTRRDVVGTPLVSIVIPTRGTNSIINGREESLVIAAVRSIIDMTTYPHFEIVVVADAVADPAVLAQLSVIAGDRLRVVTWTKPFNFSEKMNFGVLHSRGEFVLLLNDDVDVLTADWLGSMLALAQRSNAGMVGAMLYYGDDTIQHAGHAYYEGSPTHIGLGLPRGSVGPNNGYLVEREVSGVTAACALMPTKVFLEVGGLTALLPGNFNDVDLCLKVGWKGYDIYWTPHAELYHFESKSRDAHVHFYELDVIGRRWGLRLSDPRFWPGHPAAAH